MNCNSCPRKCNIDRIKGVGVCGVGFQPKVAKAYLHKWEEPLISGKNGSGTVFFSGCNLKCVYCQNYLISHQGQGKYITFDRLAEIFKELEEKGEDAVVFGRDIVTGLPMQKKIPVVMINECLVSHFSTIIDQVKLILERTPPELGADIFRNGIYLTGGASQVAHLADRLSNETGLKVQQMDNPVTSVAAGLAKVIKEDYFKTVAQRKE